MKPNIDDELKELAALALRNAFWLEFSDLVNTYLDAAKGLDIAAQEMLMGELPSIYGRKTDVRGEHCVNIWTRTDFGPVGHDTIVEALEHSEANTVHISDKKIFERVDGEWRYVENNLEEKAQ